MSSWFSKNEAIIDRVKSCKRMNSEECERHVKKSR